MNSRIRATGKTAIITGASKGIGRAAAKRMAEEGYNVIINYNHSESEAEFLYEQLKAQSLSAMLYRADITDRCQVKAMVEECLSSIWGITGGACEVHYSTAAVIGLTKSLAKELAPSNILVNCVAPGVVETDMLNGLTPSEAEMLEREIPLQKFANPEQIAESILFLASDRSSYFTGQVLSPNGGFLI